MKVRCITATLKKRLTLSSYQRKNDLRFNCTSVQNVYILLFFFTPLDQCKTLFSILL